MHIFPSKSYKKSLKKVLRSGTVRINAIEEVIDLLSLKTLPKKYRDHALVGEFAGYRECHIKSDLLLIYKYEKKVLVLVLVDIGSHSELFRK